MIHSFFVLVALSAAVSASAPAPSGGSAPAPLTGWEYRWDPPSRDETGGFVWADPNAWQPTGPYQQPKDRDGRERAWFRVALPDGDWVAPTVFIEGVDTSFEAFIQGHRVYAWGVTGPAAEPYLGWPWHLIPVHPDPGDRYLYLHVRSTHPMLLGVYGQTEIGNTQDHVRAILSRDLLTVFLGLAQLALGAAALLVFLGRREQRIYLYFALFAIAEGVNSIAFSDVKQLAFDAPGAWRLALRTARVIASPMLLAFVAEAMDSKRTRRIVQVAAALVLIGLVATAMSPVASPLAAVVLAHWQNAVFLCCSVTSVALAVAGVRNKVACAIPLLAGLVVFLGVAVYEVLHVTGVLKGARWHDVGQVALIAAMEWILLRRFFGVFEQLRVHATELEQRNDRLREVEAELQRAVRGRDEFLSIASHELRNPLATISADAWLLERDLVDSRAVDHVRSIRTQTQHLTRLVDDMLDAGRVARGALTLRTEPVDLRRALDQVLLATRASAAEKALEVSVVSPALPLWTRADPTRLDQILGNLLRNAIKYTDSGGRIEAALLREGGEVMVRVRDTGVGMAPETLQRVFRLFERGDAAAGEGMGVGLALVQSLVELHGGTVTARSDGLGKGSEFEVRLPASEPPPIQEILPPAAARLEGTNVLLIDDNANLRRSLRVALQLNGFRVSEAENGEAGVEHLLTGGFDAAVVDLRMPGLDGCEVARRVRASDLGTRLRLIALTGHAQAEERSRAEQAGFDQVLLKPTDPDELARLLARPAQG